MRLKDPFEVIEFDDEFIAVPLEKGATEYHGVIKLNETAASIFELLRDDIDEDTIISKLETEYSVSRETLVSDVHSYLLEFEKEGLLVDENHL